jgi:hypothetical protein
MKYIISVLLTTMVWVSNSNAPVGNIVTMNRYNKTDTLVPKKVPDSFTLANGKRISMIQVDSIIYRAASETMQLARKMGYAETTKQQ